MTKNAAVNFGYHCHDLAQNNYGWNGGNSGSDSQSWLPRFLSYQLFMTQNKLHCRANTTKSFLVLGKILYKVLWQRVKNEEIRPEDGFPIVIFKVILIIHAGYIAMNQT